MPRHAHGERAGARQPERFDPAKLAKLEDRSRLEYLPPATVLELLDPPRGATVVDFGAGAGMYSEEVLRLRPDLRVVAIDEQQPMLERMRERIRDARFQAGPPELLDALDGSVRGVMAINVLHEVGDDDLRRLFRRLPDATFVFVDWDRAIAERPGPPADHVFDANEAARRLEALGLAVGAPSHLRYHYALTGRPRAELACQSGFGNEFATEALRGALPHGRNSPQRPPYGLYAEQLSGTAFTAPRHANRRSWLYRIRPAAMHEPFRRIDDGRIGVRFDEQDATPNQLRWDPLPLPNEPADFVDGLVAMAGNGDPALQSGCAIYLYAANRSMRERFFCSADGELLIVPQQGRLLLATELGRLALEPHEIAVLPRGVRFRVELPDGDARGYVCENFGQHFRLPDLGPIGANGLANPRDFLAPVAWYEDRDGDFTLIEKFGGKLWSARLDHSPLDVVAWHGNCAPYTYDLRRFNTIGSISYDHPDPSIFLVLHAPSDTPGVDNLDFVIFPPRWLVAEDTFRPPWFHRNVASEFMGLVHGAYDAKEEGFVPGGASLHNALSGHGPDAESYEKARTADTTQPNHVVDTMAFMFESRWVIRPTRFALESAQLQPEYFRCWQGLRKRFDPTKREGE